MLFGSGLWFLCVGLMFILIQIGVFIPEYFFLFYSTGFSLTMFAFVFFFYYWEKNLVSLKRIPTIMAVFALIISISTVILVFTTGEYIIKLMPFITVLITLIGAVSLVILTIIFVKSVQGQLRVKGIYFIFGVFIIAFSAFTDHPPLIMLSPDLFIYLAPVTFIIGNLILFYGIKGMIDGMSSYYNQANICTVHRGKISRGESVYYCPKCTTVYCQKCYDQVIKSEGCWNCSYQVELDKKKAEKQEDNAEQELEISDEEFPKKKVEDFKLKI